MINCMFSKNQGFRLVVKPISHFSTSFKKKFRPIANKNCTNNIIDGKSLAISVKNRLSKNVKTFQSQISTGKMRSPKLGYILVGNRPDSELYVKMKKRACKQVGIETVGKNFRESVSQEEVLEYIMSLNSDPTIDGILTQLPFPEHLDETAAYSLISHEKDVDGVHPLNMAAMARHEDPLFTPCTPKGVMHLIKSVCPELTGKKATVVGRSNIVGMPISMLLQKEFATVTLCHAYTKDLKEELESADIVVSATGWPHLIKKEHIKPGAIVIDVGTTFIPDKNSKNGKKLVGDVDYNNVAPIAGHITPVPGGVGPMTIAMLMDNIITAWSRNMERENPTLLNDQSKQRGSLFSLENNASVTSNNFFI